MVCELPQKLDLLWAFIKQHLRNRTLIFVSTCKQVLSHSCITSTSLLSEPGRPITLSAYSVNRQQCKWKHEASGSY